MPEPRPTSLVVKNGSNMRSRTAGGTPLPVSATDSTAQRPLTGALHDAQTPLSDGRAQADAAPRRRR